MKKEIVAKRYGKNLVVVADGEKRTRVINTDRDKKDEELIKNKITLYNKRNSKVLLEEILYLVDTTKREKEELEAKKKGLKKAIKKESKKKEVKKKLKTTSETIDTIENASLTKNNLGKLEPMLDKAINTQKQTSTIPFTTKTPRRGEY